MNSVKKALRAFARGAATLFDVAGIFYPRPKARRYGKGAYTPIEPTMALQSDWQAVGRDMCQAFHRYEQRHSQEHS